MNWPAAFGANARRVSGEHVTTLYALPVAPSDLPPGRATFQKFSHTQKDQHQHCWRGSLDDRYENKGGV
jgi:hypothetical protein